MPRHTCWAKQTKRCAMSLGINQALVYRVTLDRVLQGDQRVIM